MILPHCQGCKATENLLKNGGGTKFGKYYQQYMCRHCNSERLTRYRTTESGKTATKKAVIKYEKSHPERVRAWRIAGRVPKEPCVMCGASPCHRHHPDVTRPNYIVFLCPKHHKEAHRNADGASAKVTNTV